METSVINPLELVHANLVGLETNAKTTDAMRRVVFTDLKLTRQLELVHANLIGLETNAKCLY